jgi:hypothetical protein
MKRMSEELAVDTKAQKLEHIFTRISQDVKLMQFFAEAASLQTFWVVCRLNKSWNAAVQSTVKMQALAWFERRKKLTDKQQRVITHETIANTDVHEWLEPHCWINLPREDVSWDHFYGERYAVHWRMHDSDEAVLCDLPSDISQAFNLREGNCLVEMALQGRSMTLLRELRMRGGDMIVMSIRHCWRRLDEMNFVRVEELAKEFGTCVYAKLLSNDNIMSMVYAEPGLVHLQRHPWLMHHEWFLKRYDYVTRVVADGEGEKMIPFLLQKKLIDAFCDRFQEGYLEKSIVVTFMENVRQFLKR